MKEALEILNIIESNSYKAYIIGGYPRDLYMGITSTDIDICTNATFNDLKNIFDIIKYRNFGSMILTYKGKDYEITTFRKEGEYDKNRFPKKIEFVNELKTDLERRDFIINTLCIDKDGNYIDLLNAKEDIDNKIIRCVGNPEFKINQDVLRSLRAIRFACKLDFNIDKSLKEAIIKYAYLIKNLSKDRITSELNEILKCEKGKLLLEELKINEFIN